MNKVMKCLLKVAHLIDVAKADGNADFRQGLK